MIHILEVTGELLLRPSGNAGFPAVECVTVRTTAWRSGEYLQIVELTTGHDRLCLPGDFSDWAPDERREVEIAVPKSFYRQLLDTASHITPGYVLGGDLRSTHVSRLKERYGKGDFDHIDLVQAPIAAVKLGGQWLLPTRTNVMQVMTKRPHLYV